MEVKRGYKQTDVGVIPEDWEVKPLDSTAFVTSGKRLPLGRSLTDHETPHPYIRVTDMRPGTVSLSDIKFVPIDAFQAIKRYRIYKEDIFISVAGTLGIVGKIPPELDGANLTENADRITDIACSQDYLLHVLMSPLIQNTIDSLQTVGAQPKLALTRIRKFDIPLPPTKAEQEAIAEALSDADALIEFLEQLLVKKRHLKQGAMQELLSDKKRLPGFSGEWRLVPLMTKVASTKFAIVDGPFGSQMKVDEFIPSGVPVIEMEHLKDSYIDQNIERCITPKKFEELKRSAVYPGDIVISKTGSLGYLGIVPDSVEKGIITSRLAKISLNPSLADRTFVFQYLLKLRNDGYWEKVSQGGTMQILGIRMLQNALIPDISVSEQTAIATVLSDMDADIAALEAKLVKARQLKQGMMQELLTGKIRLVRPVSNVIPFPPKKRSTPAPAKSHNWQINEAVIIAVLAKHVGSEQWPLARKRCTKLTYLLHRHAEHNAEGYLKKAAGPYNPDTRYKGPEAIAQKNGYVGVHHNGSYEGFVAADNIAEAESYFEKWYGRDVLVWLERFRFKKTDELELLTTVDFSVEELCRDGKAIKLDTVKRVIRDHPEWKAKLDREVFCDNNINRAIQLCSELFAD